MDSKARQNLALQRLVRSALRTVNRCRYRRVRMAEPSTAFGKMTFSEAPRSYGVGIGR